MATHTPAPAPTRTVVATLVSEQITQVADVVGTRLHKIVNDEGAKNCTVLIDNLNEWQTKTALKLRKDNALMQLQDKSWSAEQKEACVKRIVDAATAEELDAAIAPPAPGSNMKRNRGRQSKSGKRMSKYLREHSSVMIYDYFCGHLDEISGKVNHITMENLEKAHNGELLRDVLAAAQETLRQLYDAVGFRNKLIDFVSQHDLNKLGIYAHRIEAANRVVPRLALGDAVCLRGKVTKSSDEEVVAVATFCHLGGFIRDYAIPAGWAVVKLVEKSPRITLQHGKVMTYPHTYKTSAERRKLGEYRVSEELPWPLSMVVLREDGFEFPRLPRQRRRMEEGPAE